MRKVYEDALAILSPRPSPPFLTRLVEDENVTGDELRRMKELLEGRLRGADS